MKKILVLVLICLTLCGCGLQSGRVYDKKYIPAHTEVRARPVYVGEHWIYIPQPYYVDDQYWLYIRNGDERDVHAVTAAEYEKYGIGDWYGE